MDVAWQVLVVVASIIVAVMTSVVFVALLIVVSRRLLGLRIGAARASLAAIVGVGTWTVFALMVDQRGPQAWGLATIQLAVTALAAMGVLALLEVLVPSGVALRLAALKREWRRRRNRARRYRELLAIARRHGLLVYARRPRRWMNDEDHAATMARSFRKALEDAGVTFVKLGQLLSTRRDLLPPVFVDELAQLRSDAAPLPRADIDRIISTEVPQPAAAVFASLEREALAAASVAQVHAATLHTGERVVVKVQRPGIRLIIDRDVDVLRRAARSLELGGGWARRMGVAALVEGFADALYEELDFRVEARNLQAVTRLGDGGRAPHIRVPAVHSELCTERVLVMERLDGELIGSGKPPEDGCQRANVLLEYGLQQVLIDGIFHADPHPGNVVLLADGQLGLIDFGSVGRLDPTLRNGLLQLLAAVDRQDPPAARAGLLDMLGRPPQGIDERSLERALAGS